MAPCFRYQVLYAALLACGLVFLIGRVDLLIRGAAAIAVVSILTTRHPGRSTTTSGHGSRAQHRLDTRPVIGRPHSEGKSRPILAHHSSEGKGDVNELGPTKRDHFIPSLSLSLAGRGF